jgi:alpha-beta hydrolase superfamily lysophospholipase
VSHAHPPDIHGTNGLAHRPGAIGGVHATPTVDRAVRLAWRILHAGAREPFLAATPPPLRRVSWRADDGVEGTCFHMPGCPDSGHGRAGEPVLLAHGMGAGWRSFALGEASLAHALTRAGHDVYLLAHRGDVDAPATRTFDVDDVAVRDLPAAIDAIRADGGWARVLAVGHGLGAHALLLHRALLGDDTLAGMVLMGAAGRFHAPNTGHRAAALALAHLPRGWRLPSRHAPRWALPFVAGGQALGSPGTPGPVARAWVRHAELGLAGGVLAQVARWHTVGHLTDATGRLDALAAVHALQTRDPLPALVLAATDDSVARPDDVRPVADALDAEMVTLDGGHLDPLCATHAADGAHAAVLRFLDAARSRCWEPHVRAG